MVISVMFQTDIKTQPESEQNKETVTTNKIVVNPEPAPYSILDA